MLALTWNDIDFEKRTIRINKQLSRLKNFNTKIQSKTVLNVQPYTKSSNNRTISISPAIVDKLKIYKAEEDIVKAKWDKAYENNSLVFCRKDGHFVESKTFQEFFKRTLKSAGIADGNVHALRTHLQQELLKL